MQSKIDEVMKWQQTIRSLFSEMVAHHRESELARKAILLEIQLSRSNRAASELAEPCSHEYGIGEPRFLITDVCDV